MAHGEITIVKSDHAEKLMKGSHELAAEIQRVGMGVLLINCGMSDRRFREYSEPAKLKAKSEKLKRGKKNPSAEKVHLIIHSSVRGDLAGERDAIAQKVRECRIGVVIIAGWEWASSSWRRKERLIFNLRELMADEDVAVVIYTQSPTKPVLGTYDRGGIGKLAMIAIACVDHQASVILEAEVPKPPPIVITEQEALEAERSAQLFINKINGLQPQMRNAEARMEE